MSKSDKNEEKTNVMRILEQKKLTYESFSYDNTKTNAADIARAINMDAAAVYKTLVTAGKSGEHYVFMIPAESELDLKKAACAAGEKYVEMILQRDLLPLTGYIHGGCSPIGMKKQFRTFIDESALGFEKLCFSAGKVGRQVRLAPSDLLSSFPVSPAALTKDNA